MANTLEMQIWQALSEYAHKRMSLDAFRDWFVPLSLDIEESGEAGAIELAHFVYGILAEASSADWTEEQLHEELALPFLADQFGETVAGDPSPFAIPQFTVKTLDSNCAVAA